MHFGLEGYVAPVLYGISVLVFLASVFWKPQVGLYFIVPLFVLQTIRDRLIPYPLGSKLLYIIPLGVALGAAFKGRLRVPKNTLNKLLLTFVVYLYLSMCWGSLYFSLDYPISADNPRLENWMNYMIMPVVFVLVACLIKEVGQIKILLGLMFLAALLANKSLYSIVGGRDLSRFSYEMRDAGAFGWAGANGAGAFDAFFILFLIGLYIYEKRVIVKSIILAGLAFSGYCLMLTYSRGAYLGLLAGLLFLGIIKERTILLVLIVFAFTWQTLVPGSVRERVEMTHDKSTNALDDSSATRVRLWEDAINVFKTSPLMGTGFDTYEFMRRGSAIGAVAGEITLTDTHNYYLKELVETGIVGLIFFLTIVLKMLSLGYRLFRRAEDPFFKSVGLGVTAGLIAVVIGNLFGDRWQYIQEVGYLWVIIAFVVRGGESANQAPENRDLGLSANGRMELATNV